MTRLSFGRTGLAVVFSKEGNGGQGRRTELRHTLHSLYVIPIRLNLVGSPIFGHVLPTIFLLSGLSSAWSTAENSFRSELIHVSPTIRLEL